MAFLEINPTYQDLLKHWGLADSERLLALPGVIVSGHPDRHVAQVALGSGPGSVRAFLKREHRVRWKERLFSAWHGIGFTSQSYREFRLLGAIRAAGILCPEPIAAGEDGKGRAFLLVREIPGAVELRLHLQARGTNQAWVRHRRIWELGTALARIHDAGFCHPDLYTKHILVDERTGGIWFLDWQRTRRHGFLNWPRRWQDLAALDATLASELATERERLTCLSAYLRASAQIVVPRGFLLEAMRQIRERSLLLQRRRRIREQRQPPLAPGAQELVWIRGEALCVTRAFQEEMQGQLPDWLQGDGPSTRERNAIQEALLDLPGSRQADLLRRRSVQPLRWLWSCLRRRRLSSPELEQAAALFRLQRFGVATPRLLALGQHHPRPWRTESFLLTERPAGAIPLADWLNEHHDEPLKERRRVLREAGWLLKQAHSAGYLLSQFPGQQFLVRSERGSGDRPVLVLGSLKGIRRCRFARSARAWRDLSALTDLFSSVLGSGTDRLRFLLGYLNLPRLTPAAKRRITRLRPRVRFRARSASAGSPRLPLGRANKEGAKVIHSRAGDQGS